MAQDSIQNVIFTAHNCDCNCTPKQLITETGYGTNLHDVQNTREICNTILGISLIIVVAIVFATIASEIKNYFESRAKRDLKKATEEAQEKGVNLKAKVQELKKTNDMLNAKEQELAEQKKQKESNEQELQKKINELKTENSKLKEWESRFQDLEKRLEQIECKK